MKRTLFVALAALAILSVAPVAMHAQAPVCLGTDTPSTPTTGGEGGNGGYVTIYGKNFGASQGSSTVTVGGKAVAQTLLWSHNYNNGIVDAIGIQIAAGTTAGNIVVTTAAGSCSNLNWAPRTGKIYFIGPAVDNSAPGSCASMLAANSYATPWGLNSSTATAEGSYSSTTMRTPYTYFNCIAMGDTLVFLNGVKYQGYDGRVWHSSLTLDKGGASATNFLSIVGRPGALATLGGISQYGVRNTSSPNHTVYSGLNLVGGSLTGLGIANYDRATGNLFNCPKCSGESGGGVDGSEGGATGVFYGFNVVTQVSTALSSGASNKQYHCGYMAGNNFEVAYNRFYANGCYNAIQVNQDKTPGFHDFKIHDNDIADANGSCITLATVAPGLGPIAIYNNILHHCGVQRASDGGSDDPHNCISNKGTGTDQTPGTINIFSNTMFDCSPIVSSFSGSENESGALQINGGKNTGQPNVIVSLVDNVIYQPAYTYTKNYNVFFASDSVIGSLTGSHNIFYSPATPGSTAGVATVGGVIVDPLFASEAGGPWPNYYPLSGSPLIGAGISNALSLVDFAQVTRPASPSIGALEPSGTVAPPPPPPTNYPLTTSVTGQGTIGGCAGSYPALTPFKCSGTPAAGWQIDPTSWKGCTASGNTCSGTTTTAALNVSAVFTAIPPATFPVTCTPAGNGQGQVGGGCGGSFAAGANVTLTAAAAAGSTAAWTGNCPGTPSGSTWSFQMPTTGCQGTATFTLAGHLVQLSVDGNVVYSQTVP